MVEGRRMGGYSSLFLVEGSLLVTVTLGIGLDWTVMET